MTKEEFNRALDLLRQNLKPGNERELDAVVRVIAAAGRAMHGLQDAEEAEWTVGQVVAFLDRLNSAGRRELKKLAEEVELRRDTIH
jgi:hypothetical protein